MATKRSRARIETLAEGLLKAGAFQFGTFTLANGKDSPYYVNLAGLPSYPGVHKLVVDDMASLISSKIPDADALCGIPMTGLTIASPVAVALGKPLVYTRLAKQPSERVLEGEVRPGWNVVMVDDLVTTGKTILSSAMAVEQEGGDVSHAAVLIDRLEGARDRLAKRGVALHSFTDMMELADALYSTELISGDNLKSIRRAVRSSAR